MEKDGPESGTGIGGGAEVPPVGGLIQGGEEDDRQPDCGQEKGEEILKYRRHQYKENPSMNITGEDLMLVMDCDHCGPAVTENVREDCEECGQGWVREDYTLCILGNDVISLFPSLDSKTTGRIIRGEVSRSTIEFDGFNTKLGLRYIVKNMYPS